MSHAITVGGLLLGLGVLAGLGLVGVGVLTAFAAGMASVPDEKTGRTGCILFVVGFVLLVGCLVGFAA
jgi:hypothetical protein